MNWKNGHIRSWYLSPNGGGGGGASAVAEAGTGAGEGDGAGAGAGDGTGAGDDEEEDGAGEGSGDGAGEGDGAGAGEGDGDGAGQVDENAAYEALARVHGITPEEAKNRFSSSAAAAAAEPAQKTGEAAATEPPAYESPRAMAVRIHKDRGGNDNDFAAIDDLTSQIVEHRQHVGMLEMQGPVVIPQYEADFVAQGMPEGIGKLYHETLLSTARTQPVGATNNPTVRRVSQEIAIGRHVLESLKAGKAVTFGKQAAGEGGGARAEGGGNPPKATGSGAGGGNPVAKEIAALDADGKDFIQRWEKKEGRKATAADLKNFREKELI
jgi:hypothetical protein